LPDINRTPDITVVMCARPALWARGIRCADVFRFIIVATTDHPLETIIGLAGVADDDGSGGSRASLCQGWLSLSEAAR
jgi:hypothetical protein